MPGKLLGTGTVGTVDGVRRADRWLNFQYAFPPERDIRDKEDSPGGRNPYNLWPPSDLIGGEESGMTVMKIVTYDDDIRFGGTKAACSIIAGQTVDSAGSPLGGMTVELTLMDPVIFENAPRYPQLVAATVSDANGMFGFAVPNNTNKYKIDAYDGSRQGVTVRNLTGA